MKTQPNRRHRTFVSGPIQGRILSRMALYWVMYHVIVWHGLFIFHYAERRLSVTEGAAPVPALQIYWDFCIDHALLALCAILILPVFLLDFVRVIHRIAGPLVAFRNALRDMRHGRPVEQLELRQGDLLMELQEEFNEFLKAYHAGLPSNDRQCGMMPPQQAELVEELVESPCDSDARSQPAETALAVDA